MNKNKETPSPEPREMFLGARVLVVSLPAGSACSGRVGPGSRCPTLSPEAASAGGTARASRASRASVSLLSSAVGSPVDFLPPFSPAGCGPLPGTPSHASRRICELRSNTAAKGAIPAALSP